MLKGDAAICGRTGSQAGTSTEVSPERREALTAPESVGMWLVVVTCDMHRAAINSVGGERTVGRREKKRVWEATEEARCLISHVGNEEIGVVYRIEPHRVARAPRLCG